MDACIVAVISHGYLLVIESVPEFRFWILSIIVIFQNLLQVGNQEALLTIALFLTSMRVSESLVTFTCLELSHSYVPINAIIYV